MRMRKEIQKGKKNTKRRKEGRKGGGECSTQYSYTSLSGCHVGLCRSHRLFLCTGRKKEGEEDVLPTSANKTHCSPESIHITSSKSDGVSS